MFVVSSVLILFVGVAKHFMSLIHAVRFNIMTVAVRMALF